MEKKMNIRYENEECYIQEFTILLKGKGGACM